MNLSKSEKLTIVAALTTAITEGTKALENCYQNHTSSNRNMAELGVAISQRERELRQLETLRTRLTHRNKA